MLDLDSGDTETEANVVSLLAASFGIIFELLVFGWLFLLPLLEMRPGEAETRHLEI